MTETAATKGISDKLRGVFQRIVQGAGSILPGRRPAEPVEEKNIRPALEKYQADFDERTGKLAEDFESGKINLREWRGQMQHEIHMLQWAGAAVGAGGFTNLSAHGGYEELERKVREQVDYLNRWAAEIERKGKPSLAQLKNRARAYGQQAVVTASEAQNRAGGWPTLPFQPKVSTKCNGGCQCRWRWMIKDAQNLDADVFWELAEAEHCPTCIARSKACYPLKIRNGAFENLPSNMSELMFNRQ